MRTRCGMLLLLLPLLSACAVMPTGPHVMVLPSVEKPFDQVQVDDVVCQHSAQQQLGITPGKASTQSAVQSAALGTILGAAAGAAIGAAGGNAGTGAAVGAGSGLLLGGATGAQAASASSETLQWRYDVAYTQCRLCWRTPMQRTPTPQRVRHVAAVDVDRSTTPRPAPG
jgi:hypothetical protein